MKPLCSSNTASFCRSRSAGEVLVEEAAVADSSAATRRSASRNACASSSACRRSKLAGVPCTPVEVRHDRRDSRPAPGGAAARPAPARACRRQPCRHTGDGVPPQPRQCAAAAHRGIGHEFAVAAMASGGSALAARSERRCYERWKLARIDGKAVTRIFERESAGFRLEERAAARRAGARMTGSPNRHRRRGPQAPRRGATSRCRNDPVRGRPAHFQHVHPPRILAPMMPTWWDRVAGLQHPMRSSMATNRSKWSAGCRVGD